VLSEDLVEFGLLICLVMKGPLVITRAIPELDQVGGVLIEEGPKAF